MIVEVTIRLLDEGHSMQVEWKATAKALHGEPAMNDAEANEIVDTLLEVCEGNDRFGEIKKTGPGA